MNIIYVTTPLWAKCEGEAHTPKNGKLESSVTPENSELDFRVQISSHLNDLGVIGKVLKCRCPKWPRMSHLDICSLSYRRKTGRESNWQFDPRPLKVRNRPVPNMRSRSATLRWKALFEGYNFGLDLVPIGGRGKELQSPKVPGVQTGSPKESNCITEIFRSVNPQSAPPWVPWAPPRGAPFFPHFLVLWSCAKPLRSPTSISLGLAPFEKSPFLDKISLGFKTRTLELFGLFPLWGVLASQISGSSSPQALITKWRTPNSLQDSNVSPNERQRKSEELGHVP